MQTALDVVKAQFETDDLLAEQVNSFKAFFVENHVFVNITTGYGKSLIFQCVADVLHVFSSASQAM